MSGKSKIIQALADEALAAGKIVHVVTTELLADVLSVRPAPLPSPFVYSVDLDSRHSYPPDGPILERQVNEALLRCMCADDPDACDDDLLWLELTDSPPERVSWRELWIPADTNPMSNDA